jgi:hypothetical protein
MTPGTLPFIRLLQMRYVFVWDSEEAHFAQTQPSRVKLSGTMMRSKNEADLRCLLT